MEKFEILPKEKVEVVLSGVPVPTNYPWLFEYTCNPNDFFTNSIYLNKLIGAKLMLSGSAIYSLDTVRVHNNDLDRDRRLITLSGNQILMQTKIHKDFLEHHQSTSLLPQPDHQ